MAPPKRALLSVTLDTDADHVYQRVEDHNKDGDDRITVLETKGPSLGHTDLKVLTKPFESVVDRTVQGFVDGTGRRVDSVEGTLEYGTHRSERTSASGHKVVRRVKNDSSNSNSSNHKNREKRKESIEDQYDTSEL
jgi:hypothetical protein